MRYLKQKTGQVWSQRRRKCKSSIYENKKTEQKHYSNSTAHSEFGQISNENMEILYSMVQLEFYNIMGIAWSLGL